MLTAFLHEAAHAWRIDPAPSAEALGQALWIDLLLATADETAQVRAATGLDIPDEAAINEIESSSRLSTRNDVLYINMPIISMTDGPRGVAVGFVLSADRLITIRFAASRSFESYTDQLRRGESTREGPAHVFVGLVEAIIDRQADALEVIRTDLEKISARIFRLGAAGGGRRDEDQRLRSTLRELGTIGDLISHIRETQVAAARIVPYVETVAADWLPKDIRARLRTLRRDIASVSDFSTHLNDKLQFMLDATLGFINIAQNNLMKVMTITSVAGIPPVLIAGIYGMNFKAMPELDWAWGYAWGLGLITISTIIPLLIFRWRKWI